MLPSHGNRNMDTTHSPAHVVVTRRVSTNPEITLRAASVRQNFFHAPSGACMA